MKVGDGKPFVAIIVGKVPLKDVDENIVKPYVLSDGELRKLPFRVRELGFNVMFQDRSGMIIEAPYHLVSVCSKMFINISFCGGVIVTILDLGYISRHEFHLRDTLELIEKCKNIIEKLLPERRFEVFDVQILNYPLRASEIATVEF